MSNWATRCNACGTSFRVTEEQLRISDGHVRCGRCDAVFDARVGLFDLDAAASAPAPLSPPSVPAQAPRVEEASAPQGPAPNPMASATLPEASEQRMTSPVEPVWEPELAVATNDSARAEPIWQETEAPPVNGEEANAKLRELLRVEPRVEHDASFAAPSEAAVFASLSGSSRPSPARARSSARWNAFGGLLAGLLALALPVQWAWIEREALRAGLPRVDALLAEQGFPAEGWRHLEGLTVIGSTLQATPQGGAYRLELQLQNRAAHRVAMPWLDLRLSDSSGATLVRRALAPSELAAPAVLAAGEQQQLQAVFRLDSRGASVNGYELGLFHP